MNFSGPPPTIALITDFGERDGFTGVLKGVLYGLLETPGIPVVDISHGITPQNIREGAWVLENSYPYFPKGTLFVCIVDPFVGNPAQQKLIVHWPEREQYFIAPDNGLLTPILEAGGQGLEIRTLQNSRYFRPGESPSQTFHGRDIYIPATAHLANALMKKQAPSFLEAIGPRIEGCVKHPRPQPQLKSERSYIEAAGEVCHIDHYGNLITNIPNHWLPTSTTPLTIFFGEAKNTLETRWVASYSDPAAPPDQIFALPGSHGRIELALFSKSAQQATSLQISAPLLLRWMKETQDKGNIQIV